MIGGGKQVKPYLKMIRRFDIVLVVLLTLLSFLPLAIFSYVKANEPKSIANQGLTAVITVDGKEYKKVALTGHTGTESFTITQADGDSNTIEVKDEQIRISKATCGDQVCVRTGAITKRGETIVCLPHKLVIEVKATDGDSNNNDDGDMIISS